MLLFKYHKLRKSWKKSAIFAWNVKCRFYFLWIVKGTIYFPWKCIFSPPLPTFATLRRVSRAPVNMKGIQTLSKMHLPAEWRVSHSPLDLNGIQTLSKMRSPAGWRVSHVPLNLNALDLNGIQTHSEMHSPTAWLKRFYTLNLNWTGFKPIRRSFTSNWTWNQI